MATTISRHTKFSTRTEGQQKIFVIRLVECLWQFSRTGGGAGSQRPSAMSYEPLWAMAY
eukprot:SAG31_NODE_43382_length_267_cov_0.875000_1_plen_59_part_00